MVINKAAKRCCRVYLEFRKRKRRGREERGLMYSGEGNSGDVKHYHQSLALKYSCLRVHLSLHASSRNSVTLACNCCILGGLNFRNPQSRQTFTVKTRRLICRIVPHVPLRHVVKTNKYLITFTNTFDWNYAKFKTSFIPNIIRFVPLRFTHWKKEMLKISRTTHVLLLLVWYNCSFYF